MFKKKPTASEVDGVQYRRAKLWQIICYACNGLVGMSVYSLIGMASYSASIGYGITTAAVGIILTCSRILDGITDPLLAFVYDRVNTKFGKLRILMVAGFLIEALALYGMFTGFSSKGLGLPVFALLYIVYIIGYTITNMTAQTIPAIMTNDPRQRPTIGVWTTVFNYMVPMAMSMVLNVVLLPKCGGTYNPVSYTHLRAHETDSYLVCRLLLEKKKKNKNNYCMFNRQIAKTQTNRGQMILRRVREMINA